MNLYTAISLTGLLSVITFITGDNEHHASAQISLIIYTVFTVIYASLFLFYPNHAASTHFELTNFDEHHKLLCRGLAFFIIMNTIISWYTPLDISFRVNSLLIAMYTTCASFYSNTCTSTKPTFKLFQLLLIVFTVMNLFIFFI